MLDFKSINLNLLGCIKMNYKIIEKEKYYRKGVYRHFTKDCGCATSMTSRIDVTDLVDYSKKTDTPTRNRLPCCTRGVITEQKIYSNWLSAC